MIREAELFVSVERVLVEVVGRVRSEDWTIVLPSLFDLPGYDQPRTIKETVHRHVRELAGLPDILAGRRSDHVGLDTLERELRAANPYEVVARQSEASCAAARQVTDGAAAVHADWGDVTTRDYLWRLTFASTFIAHDIAFGLGGTACPLTEEFSRAAYEATAPKAWRWRSLGLFRDPLPLPDRHVSWRDQFLLMAGRDPHPVH